MFEPYEIGPIECAYCGNVAKFTVAAEHSEITSREFEEQDGPWGSSTRTVEWGWVYRMFICSQCKKASFDRVYYRDGDLEYDEPLYPEPISVPEGLPTLVEKEYRDALTERRRNPNGYAALLGRVLDAVCTDRGIPSSSGGRPMTLGPRLKKLAADNGLNAVDGAVGLRNVAAHSDLGGLTAEDIPYLETLVRYILDHLYVISAVNQRALDVRQNPKI